MERERSVSHGQRRVEKGCYGVLLRGMAPMTRAGSRKQDRNSLGPMRYLKSAACAACAGAAIRVLAGASFSVNEKFLPGPVASGALAFLGHEG